MFPCSPASLPSSLAIQVGVLLLGGVPDPVIHLNSTDAVAFCTLSSASSPCANDKVIGFSGWQGPWGTVSGNPSADALMMRQSGFASLSAPVQEHVRSEAARIASRCPAKDATTTPNMVETGKDNCTAVEPTWIRASDDPTTIHFDVEHDDGGCFLNEQPNNNCYNYGTDVISNTFAQPGRGSGVCSHTTRPCVANTCADVRKAAESDGLVWVGESADLPKTLPESGHYVSLHIWPDSNFHWLRMDADMTWSHKPGGSPVKNVDNNGAKIKDPAQADVSPWTLHCGYMLTHPSNVSLY